MSLFKQSDNEHYEHLLGIRKYALSLLSENKQIAAKIVEEDYPKWIEVLFSKKQCVRCNAEYWNYQNIGSWRCFMHTDDIDRVNLVYRCCNQSTLSSDRKNTVPGCTPCDHAHNSSVLTAQANIIIPEAVFALLENPLQEAIESHDLENNILTVRRFRKCWRETVPCGQIHKPI